MKVLFDSLVAVVLEEI